MATPEDGSDTCIETRLNELQAAGYLFLINKKTWKIIPPVEAYRVFTEEELQQVAKLILSRSQ